MNKNIKKTYVAPKIEFLEIQMQDQDSYGSAENSTVGASGTANLGNFGYGGELGGVQP